MPPTLRELPRVSVEIQRTGNGYSMTLPDGKQVAVNRKDRRAIDAESRRKKRRGHVRR